MTKFTMAMPACTQKLGSPKARMVRSMEKLRRMAGKRSRMGTSLRRQKYCSTAKHEQAQPSTVARALPMTPQPSASTNNALKATDPTRPMTMVPSARLGAPQVRMKLFTPRPMHCKMKPAQRIWMNVWA